MFVVSKLGFKTAYIVGTLTSWDQIVSGFRSHLCKLQPNSISLSQLCTFPVRVCILSKDVHYQWVTSQFPVRHIPIHGENVHSSEWHCHSRLGCLFVCGLSTPGTTVCFTENEGVLHREWGSAPPGMGSALHRERTFSPGIYILTGNEDVPHL